MHFLIALLVILGFSSCSRTGGQGSDTKIVNGRIVSKSDYPGVAELRITAPGQKPFFCTATKISPSHWATAAHCVNDVQPSAVKIVTSEGTLPTRKIVVAGTEDGLGSPRISPENDLAILVTDGTESEFYAMGPYRQSYQTQILGFGVASNCSEFKEDDELSDRVTDCSVTRSNSRAGTLRVGTIDPEQIQAVNDEVVTFVSPIVPDDSRVAGPGLGDSGGPLIQGDTLVGILHGAQFDRIPLRNDGSLIAADNRQLAIYIHSQSQYFCSLIRRVAANDGESEAELVGNCSQDIVALEDGKGARNVCKDGYYRDVDGTCVRESRSPTCTGTSSYDESAGECQRKSPSGMRYSRTKKLSPVGEYKVNSDGTRSKGYSRSESVAWPRAVDDLYSDPYYGMAGRVNPRAGESFLRRQAEMRRRVEEANSQNIETTVFQP